MIHFHMVNNQVVNLFRINDGTDMVHEILVIRPFYRIDQGYFFINDQECIIGRTTIG